MYKIIIITFKMCWSKNVSLASFALGTVINLALINKAKNNLVITLCLLWQFVIFMQLWDAIAWSYPICGSDGNVLATRGAYIFNILQPVVAYMLLVCISPVELKYKVLAGVAMLFYLGWMMVKDPYNDNLCLKPSQNCTHLNYDWWHGNSGKVYIIVLTAIILLLIRPLKMATITAGYILGTLAISQAFYGCGAPSIWCWLVSIGGLTTLAV
jgi:hypothetical protein